jgi:uncharacterized iron-regulated membrane protein
MKKIIKKLHLYLALVLCLPLIIQGITGSILVFEHEITEQNYTLAEGEKHQLSEVITAAQSQVAEGFKPNFIKLDEAVSVRFSKKTADKNSISEVVVDPSSLEILEVKNLDTNLFRLIKRFHASLLIPGEIGKNIVGIYGFVLLFMAISGIILWWPKPQFIKRAFTFKFSDKGKKFHRDIHGAIGFYLAIPMLIVAFSGIYFIYPKGTTSFVTSIFPGENLKETANAIKVNPATSTKSIDELLLVAKTEGEPLSISISAKPDQPYRFNFAPENYIQGEPLITVFVDQYEGKIIEKRDPKNYSVGEKIIAWQHPLHVGEEFGVVSKAVNFLLGLSILLFAITGILLWWIKRKNRKK